MEDIAVARADRPGGQAEYRNGSRIGPRPKQSLLIRAALALGLAGVAGSVLGGVASRHVAGSDGAEPLAAPARLAAVEPLLHRRSAAVLAGDPTGWESSLDPDRPDLRSSQLVSFSRIRSLPVRSWDYQVMDTVVAGAGSRGRGTPASFTVQVRLGYRLPGDTRDVTVQEKLTVTRGRKGWRISEVEDQTGPGAVWTLGALTVRQSARGVVIRIGRADPSESLPTPVTAGGQDVGGQDVGGQDVDGAAAAVDAGWGTRWRRTVVVVVPQTLQQMAVLLGRADSAGLDQLAAVTGGEADPDVAGSRAGSADRVVLDPSVFPRLTPLGRRVVLTHEFVHVASRQATRTGTGTAPPVWVQEGFADYLAYRAWRVPSGVAASDAVAAVRSGTAAAHLPAASAFDPARGRVGVAYADAWLAFDLMAQSGPDVPAAFYRAAAGLTSPGRGPGLDAVFRQVLGVDQSGFEARWLRHRALIASHSS